jgi:hypothetical protein
MATEEYPAWVKNVTHRKMHDDFRVFLWWLWKQLGLPDPTEAQYEIAEYLQHGPKRRIVMAFRGIGKSWITAAFVIWCLLRDPNERIMVVSASEYKALEFCTFTKACIETLPLLHWLLAKPNQRDSTLAFDVGPSGPHQAPSVRAVGITGQMTGGRASKVVFDDIEVPNNSLTEGKREILTARAREMGGAILMPTIGQSIGLGTPQSVQSIYGGFEERGYEIRVWPARYPTDAQEANFQGRLAPGILRRLRDDNGLVGRPTDPDRFDEQDLAEREAEYGRSGFNLQFMLDTTLSDGTRFPLKFRDLIVTDIDSEVGPDRLLWASGPAQEIKDVPNVGLTGDRFYGPLNQPESFSEYEGSVMVIDPAGRGKDETSYAVTKSLHGKVFVTRWGGLAGGYDGETLKQLVLIAKEQKVNLVKIESNFGDGMFTALISPIFTELYPCTVEEYSVHTQKELRIIDKLEPAMNQHRVVMDKEIVLKQNADLPEDAGERERYYNGFYQMAYLTKDRGALKQDDRIDILAEGVGHWVESVDRDEAKAASRSKEKKLDAELQKFARGIKNLRPKKGVRPSLKSAMRRSRKSIR